MPTARVREYSLWRVLGKGTYGEVWLATHAVSQRLYAIKTLDKHFLLQRHAVDKVLAEKSILQQLSFPFLIELKCSFQDERHVYLVLEYVPGGDLFHLMHPDGDIGKQRRWNEAETRFYVCEVVLALEHLHARKIIYRDLKPENILVGMDGHLKLTDFGLAKQDLSGPLLRGHSLVGTPEYMSPEMVHSDEHGEEVDWWALGVLTYELLFGCFPFRYHTPPRRYPDVERPVTFPEGHGASQHACDLVLALLQPKPARRLGHLGAQQVKAHPFFQGVNWGTVLSKGLSPPVVPARLPAMATRLRHDELLLGGSAGLLRRHKLFPAHRTPGLPDSVADVPQHLHGHSHSQLELKSLFEDARERGSACTARDVRESVAVELVQLLRDGDRAHLEARLARLVEPHCQWLVHGPSGPNAHSAGCPDSAHASGSAQSDANSSNNNNNNNNYGSNGNNNGGASAGHCNNNHNNKGVRGGNGSGNGAHGHGHTLAHTHTQRLEGISGFVTHARSMQRKWAHFRFADCEVVGFDSRTVTVHWVLALPPAGTHTHNHGHTHPDSAHGVHGDFVFTFCGPKVVMGVNSYDERPAHRLPRRLSA